jgi:hypothetical protein
MKRSLWLLPLLALPVLGPATCPSGGPSGLLVMQEYRHDSAYVEPHTPGSGVAGVEMAATPNVQSVVGATPDLNRVSYLRTFLAKPNAPPPRAIWIVVPGFLGGGGTFTPLARQLVQKYNGNLEVWAVDRRPNQLEDRRGADYTVDQIAAATSTDEVRDALYAGTFFYLPEDGSFDTNENGEIDDPTELPDALGDPRSYVLLEQDDLRFFAHWGVDTYVRDWKTLVDRARSIVGADGVVLFGGHSQGTYWASVFAAYDFDPDPDVVDAGYEHLDGIVLLEGGGAGSGPSASAPDLAEYEATVADLETAGGPDVYLDDFQGIQPAVLGPAAELAGLAGIHLPDESAILQRTAVFGAPPFTLFFTAPFDNRAQIAFFIDDDTQPITAFRASLGFSDDGRNTLIPGGGFLGEFYFAAANATLRRFKDFDDPTLPTCPPNVRNVSPGCAIEDLGPPGDTSNPSGPRWGVEAEVTSLDDVLEIQALASNFVEWYFGSGRPGLDGAYGNDSSALVAESVAAHGHEGPLVLTQQANVDVPILCIGGSNGLTPLASNFASYLASIATPTADQEIAILEGYAHLDPLTARDNGAVPVIADWINRQLVRKLLEP